MYFQIQLLLASLVLGVVAIASVTLNSVVLSAMHLFT